MHWSVPVEYVQFLLNAVQIRYISVHILIPVERRFLVRNEHFEFLYRWIITFHISITVINKLCFFTVYVPWLVCLLLMVRNVTYQWYVG